MTDLDIDCPMCVKLVQDFALKKGLIMFLKLEGEIRLIILNLIILKMELLILVLFFRKLKLSIKLCRIGGRQ